MKFVSDLRQVGGIFGYSYHQLNYMLLKVALNTIPLPPTPPHTHRDKHNCES